MTTNHFSWLISYDKKHTNAYFIPLDWWINIIQSKQQHMIQIRSRRENMFCICNRFFCFYFSFPFSHLDVSINHIKLFWEKYIHKQKGWKTIKLLMAIPWTETKRILFVSTVTSNRILKENLNTCFSQYDSIWLYMHLFYQCHKFDFIFFFFRTITNNKFIAEPKSLCTFTSFKTKTKRNQDVMKHVMCYGFVWMFI